MPPMSATLTPLFNRKPLIASVQWFFARALSRQYRLPFFLGERYGIRLYRNFIVQTETMRRHIERLHRRARCELIPVGADDALFELSPRFGDFVLYLGRVDFAQKGVDLLLRAFARVPERERLPLVVAGHGFQWEAFHRLVGELGLASWVRVAGRVDRDERNRLLSECRFVCVPSREETFGMVILEACAAGKPVVLFDAAPMNEVAARDGCELVEPFDPERYGEALRRLLALTLDELSRRGGRCRAWAQGFRWDAIAERQEAFYRRVLAGSDSR